MWKISFVHLSSKIHAIQPSSPQFSWHNTWISKSLNIHQRITLNSKVKSTFGLRSFNCMHKQHRAQPEKMYKSPNCMQNNNYNAIGIAKNHINDT